MLPAAASIFDTFVYFNHDSFWPLYMKAENSTASVFVPICAGAALVWGLSGKKSSILCKQAAADKITPILTAAFAYIHSEKDILKLVNTLILNTKGDGQGGDPFWTKAETLLLTSLVGYLHYHMLPKEQNFSMLLDMLNLMDVREDDEDYKNPVDLLFEKIEKKNPHGFAVRQYKKYKLSAGVT